MSSVSSGDVTSLNSKFAQQPFISKFQLLYNFFTDDLAVLMKKEHFRKSVKKAQTNAFNLIEYLSAFMYVGMNGCIHP